jgi:hypothetical protein
MRDFMGTSFWGSLLGGQLPREPEVTAVSGVTNRLAFPSCPAGPPLTPGVVHSPETAASLGPAAVVSVVVAPGFGPRSLGKEQGVRRSRVAFALGVVVPLLVMGGCSDDDPEPRIAPSPSPTSTVSGSPSATPSRPVEPSMPAAANGSGPGAASAFIEYFWDLVNYSQASGDVGQLEEVALASCNACGGGSGWIKKVYSRGGRIRGGEYSTADVSPKRLYVQDQLIYQVDVQVSSTVQRVEHAGNLNAVYPAKTATFRFLVNRHDRNWRVGRWEVRS